MTLLGSVVLWVVHYSFSLLFFSCSISSFAIKYWSMKKKFNTNIEEAMFANNSNPNSLSNNEIVANMPKAKKSVDNFIRQ